VVQTPYAGPRLDNARIKAECKRISDSGIIHTIKTIEQIPELSSLSKCMGNPLSAKVYYDHIIFIKIIHYQVLPH
jgi:hypothetical protein